MVVSRPFKKIKVILKKTGEIKEVAFGYAVNFLIPKGLAIRATEKAIKQLAIEQLREKENVQTKLLDEKKLVQKLAGKEFVIKTKAGKKGQLFGAVTKKDLSKELGIEKKAIVLEKPIKKIGDYKIDLKLASERVKVKVTVIPAST